MDYKTKYLKYKLKYNELKKQFGGTKIGDEIYNIKDPSDSWGKIVGEDGDKWLLESGRIAKKINENKIWMSRSVVSKSSSQPVQIAPPQPIRAPPQPIRAPPPPLSQPLQMQMEFDYSLTDYKIYKVKWRTPSKHRYSQWEFKEVRAKIVNALSQEDAIRIASEGENNNHTIICELLGKSYFHGNRIFSEDAYYQNG